MGPELSFKLACYVRIKDAPRFGHWRVRGLRPVRDLFARQQIAERNLYFCATIRTAADEGLGYRGPG